MKLVHIKQPPGSGANYYNYKGFYSIVLFAMVDVNYNFLYVNGGANGKVNDAGIFRESALFNALQNNTLIMPQGHVILGAGAFPLKTYLMKLHTNMTRSNNVHL
jgi:hypothetical protein